MTGVQTCALPIFIATLSYYSTSSTDNKHQGPRPVNFRKCNPEANYKLDFLSLEVDHDLEPGKKTIMTSKWMPKENGHFEKMIMRIVVGKIKVSKEDTSPAEFTGNTEFLYKYEVALPSIIPHVFVTMKMSIYADKNASNELSCVAFDVQM